jgi:hypothetical protein
MQRSAPVSRRRKRADDGRFAFLQHLVFITLAVINSIFKLVWDFVDTHCAAGYKGLTSPAFLLGRSYI